LLNFLHKSKNVSGIYVDNSGVYTGVSKEILYFKNR